MTDIITRTATPWFVAQLDENGFIDGIIPKEQASKAAAEKRAREMASEASEAGSPMAFQAIKLGKAYRAQTEQVTKVTEFAASV